MRIIALLALCCSFALCSEVRWPAEKDTPAWAKELTTAWKAAYGPGSAIPDRPTQEQVNDRGRREKAYWDKFDAAVVNWLPRANLQPLANEGGKDVEYNQRAASLRNGVKRNLLRAADAESMHRYDRWFMRYAEAHNDPIALVFLYTSTNRTKYGAPN